MVGTMRVQLLYFDGCLHWIFMEERLREALTLSGIPQTIEHCLVETPEEADEYRFAGSPSILLDGRDPFASSPREVGWHCCIEHELAGDRRGSSLLRG